MLVYTGNRPREGGVTMSKKSAVILVLTLLLMLTVVSPVFAGGPTIRLECVFKVGEGPALSQGPVTIPDLEDRLQSYRMECMNNGGYLAREK